MPRSEKTARVLTLVFTDLADSTALKTARGDEAVGDLIRRHRGVISRLAAECSGRIIDWAGDGCFLTFETSSAGVVFGLRLQQAHAEDPALPGVRVGIHMGEVSEGTGADGRPDIIGLAVDISARVCALARPGQVLMSASVYQSARQRLGVDVFGKPILWQAHGPYELKGYDEPFEIREAGLEGLSPLLAPESSEKASRATVSGISSDDSASTRRRSAMVPILLSTIALVLVIAAAVYLGGARDGRPDVGVTETPAPEAIQSIAVLPFTNMSGEAGQEYFVDGMTEALITELAKIGSLKVISRTSAMRYKNTTLSIPEIAAELDVDGIVEGSALREGDMVRITAQLIHARTDVHRWAGSFDRAVTSVLKLHSELALAIAAEVQANLTPAERARIASAPEVNPRAYELYIEGRALWSERNPAGFEAARQRFEAALEIDQNFALAHAGLADVYAAYPSYNIMSVRDAIPRSNDHVNQALAIDPNQSEAYSSRGFGRLLQWDWDGAEADYKRAIELNPGNAAARQWYAQFLDTTNRSEEGLDQIERALELDPFSPSIVAVHVEMLAAYGPPEVASQRAAQIRAEFTDNARVFQGLQWAYWDLGERENAVWAERRFIEFNGDTLDTQLWTALSTAKRGQHAESRNLLERVITQVELRSVGYGLVASTYAHLGEMDEAFRWLELAIEHYDDTLTWIGVDDKSNYLWRPLQSDPRYESILDRVNFPEWARRN